MEDFKFTTNEPLATNSDTMDWFANEHFYKVFDKEAIFIEEDGSYAEVLDGGGTKWALHASGDGDFTHHRIRFEVLSCECVMCGSTSVTITDDADICHDCGYIYT